MHLPPLLKGTLVQRYKRFLADVILEDGTAITAHCPNSGAMVDIKTPGMTVYVSTSDNPKRKLAYTLEFVEHGGVLVAANTGYPNKVVGEALKAGFFPFIDKDAPFRSEAPINKETRFDFCVTEPAHKTWIEVKSSHFHRGGVALFPDAVTTRGKKHLETLMAAKAAGDRAIMIYVVQRDDAECFGPSFHYDKAYSETFYKAMAAGVEIYAYTCTIDLKTVTLNRPLKILTEQEICSEQKQP